MLYSIFVAIALQSAPAAAPPSCDSEAHAEFDFWVGEWDVYPNGQDTKVANSRIERKHNGCAVIENWMPLRGQGGTSLNHLDPETGIWHQKWVGSSPGAVMFSGGVAQGSMVLTGNWPSPAAPHQLIRMSYTANADGSVRQHGEASTDHGLSWQTSFDFIYRPKDPPK
ncbi:hypothetical protein [Parerythrobacter jejuensis]|uniref:DUF1579 domain-containing protein n=1 Tax=Parerythrobacter jejuensis TaxID=795812 RepID=A0A845ATP8_9SPHN|nr:hypothetical protein [Parerythrobacter jejuensis]MXP32523.1 hypothetical protein [Parerythrobacter jejuensis]